MTSSHIKLFGLDQPSDDEDKNSNPALDVKQNLSELDRV